MKRLIKTRIKLLETISDLKYLEYISWADVLSLLGFSDEEINEYKKDEDKKNG